MRTTFHLDNTLLRPVPADGFVGEACVVCSKPLSGDARRSRLVCSTHCRIIRQHKLNLAWHSRQPDLPQEGPRLASFEQVAKGIDLQVDCRIVRQQLAARDGLVAAVVMLRLAEGSATTGQLIDVVGLRRNRITDVLSRLHRADIVAKMICYTEHDERQYCVWSLQLEDPGVNFIMEPFVSDQMTRDNGNSRLDVGGQFEVVRRGQIATAVFTPFPAWTARP